MKKTILFAIVIVAASPLFSQKQIAAEDANKYVGENVVITGKIAKATGEKSKNTATIMNLATNGSNPVNIVISNEDRKNFPYNPEDYLNNKKVSVKGKVTDTNGKPSIVINGPEDIKVQPQTPGGEIKPLEFDGFNRYFND